jgi:hypothetical protein
MIGSDVVFSRIVFHRINTYYDGVPHKHYITDKECNKIIRLIDKWSLYFIPKNNKLIDKIQLHHENVAHFYSKYLPFLYKEIVFINEHVMGKLFDPIDLLNNNNKQFNFCDEIINPALINKFECDWINFPLTQLIYSFYSCSCIDNIDEYVNSDEHIYRKIIKQMCQILESKLNFNFSIYKHLRFDNC